MQATTVQGLRRRLWATRPLRVWALGRAYGVAGLADHGLARLRRDRREIHQLWQGPPQPAPGVGTADPGLGAAILACSAAELRPYAAELLPFKRGIAGLLREMQRRPQQVLAVVALQGPRLRGMAMATQRAAGLWMVHDLFVFPDERRAGLGQGLLAAISRRVGEVEASGGALTLWAEILPYNRASQAVFRQCAWREVAVSQRRAGTYGPTL